MVELAMFGQYMKDTVCIHTNILRTRLLANLVRKIFVHTYKQTVCNTLNHDLNRSI